jgi:adenylosuccinate lyase
MVQIWDEKTRVMIARGIWVTVMRHQKVSADVVADYKAKMREVDLESIRKREEVTGHQTKAWLEEFNELAGHQAAHHGLTSCDITENVTDWQIRTGITHLLSLVVALGVRLASAADLYATVPMVGRTHNLPAQVTTVGRRFTVCLQETMTTFSNLNHFRTHQTMHGLKGAVGTQADLLRTMGGDDNRVFELEAEIANINELPLVAAASGQTPQRGQDAAIAGAVVGVCSGPASLATTLRLMVGQGLGSELAPAGTTGSSAMPHKQNPRYAERVCGLLGVVKGFARMLTDSVGGIWNEGDVSDSSLRRVALPGLFLAAEGLLRSAMIMLDRFTPDLDAIEEELDGHRYVLKSGALLDHLVQKGCGREDAHRILREWFTGGINPEGHEIFHWVTSDRIHDIVNEPWDLGTTAWQIDVMRTWAKTMARLHPASASYEPGAML